jgi:hypothetical protein
MGRPMAAPRILIKRGEHLSLPKKPVRFSERTNGFVML